MLKRVESLRAQMLQAMGDHGSKLEHLKPEETLAIVVHLFNGYDDPKRPVPISDDFSRQEGSHP